MRGYPKHVATKQDHMNLLAMPEYKERTLKDLKELYNTNDDTATRATTLVDPSDESKGQNVVQIKNPNPLWKQKGFASRQEVADIVLVNGGAL